MPSEDQDIRDEDLDYSEEAMQKRVKEDIQRTLKFVSGWKEEAKEDLQFKVGEQWTEEEKNILAEQLRPSLVINKSAVQCDVLSGYERNNSARIKVSPEGTEDKVFSEIADKCMSYVDKVGFLDYKTGLQFDDGIGCGKGNLELVLDYDKDPLHGDLIPRQVSPFTVFYDPDSREYDLSDAEFSFKLQRYTRAKLKALYPKKKNTIREFSLGGTNDWLDQDYVTYEGDADNYGVGKQAGSGTAGGAPTSAPSPEEEMRGKHTLAEYWYKRYVKRYFLYDIDLKRLQKFDTKEDAEARIAELKEAYVQDPETVSALEGMEPTERMVPEMWVYATANGEVLEHGKSPLEPRYSGFPFFRFISYYTPSAETEAQRAQGLMRRLKDPQREVNKARSQYLHILNTGPNSGWIGDSDALSETDWGELAAMGSKPGIIVKKKPGTQLERIEPANPSYAQSLREKTASENLKEVTGLNTDLLSMDDKNISGKAMAIRIKQALTIVAGIFDNWRMTKRLIGECIFKLIPEIMDAEKLQRIVGEAFMETNQITKGDLVAFLARIEDGKYDVSVAESTDSMTLRAETFEQLLEIGERSGTPIPPDLMLEFSNIPNATEAAKKIQEYQAQQQAAAQQQEAATAQ